MDTTANYRKWFWLAAAIAVSAAAVSPALALLMGAAAAPLAAASGGNAPKMSKYLLQASVVMLGCGLEIMSILKLGAHSLLITFIGISFTLIAGYFIGKLLRVGEHVSALISGGTAICGGSAIAALSPAIGASQGDTAIALAVVFLLNAVALVIFPQIGHLFSMSQNMFGLWSAMAIHDTSSVVGAASAYGAQALAVATTVKLTRALWILPVSFAYAKKRGTQTKLHAPWFLLGFLGAALLSSLLPEFKVFWHALSGAGRHLMGGALFLVGTGLTAADLKKAGLRPLAKGVLLWVLVSGVSLAAIISLELTP